MKPYILIADLDTNERSDIEGLENQVFETSLDALSQINNGNDIINKCVPLSDFLEMVNNEEFYDGNCWITSVLINKN